MSDAPVRKVSQEDFEHFCRLMKITRTEKTADGKLISVADPQGFFDWMYARHYMGDGITCAQDPTGKPLIFTLMDYAVDQHIAGLIDVMIWQKDFDEAKINWHHEGRDINLRTYLQAKHLPPSDHDYFLRQMEHAYLFRAVDKFSPAKGHIQKGYLDNFINVLRRKGNNPNIVHPFLGAHLLQKAASAGQHELVAALLDTPGLYPTECGPKEHTALHQLCIGGPEPGGLRTPEDYEKTAKLLLTRVHDMALVDYHSLRPNEQGGMIDKTCNSLQFAMEKAIYACEQQERLPTAFNEMRAAHRLKMVELFAQHAPGLESHQIFTIPNTHEPRFKITLHDLAEHSARHRSSVSHPSRDSDHHKGGASILQKLTGRHAPQPGSVFDLSHAEKQAARAIRKGMSRRSLVPIQHCAQQGKEGERGI